MKKLIVFILTSISITSSFSQKLFTDSEERFSEIHDIVFTSETEYIIASSGEYDDDIKVEYFKDGTSLRAYTMPYANVQDMELYSVEEGTILALTAVDECDVFTNDYIEVLLDTLKSYTIYSDYDPWFPDTYVKTIRMGEGKLGALIGYSQSNFIKGLKVFENEEEIFALEVTEQKLTDLKSYDPYTFFYGEGILLVYDQVMNQIDTLLLHEGESILDIEFDYLTGLYYVLATDRIYITAIDSVNSFADLPVEGRSYSDLLFVDKLYVLGHSEEEKNMLWTMENGTLAEADLELPDNRYEFTEMYLGLNDQIWFVGQTNLYYNPNTNQYGRGAYVYYTQDLNSDLTMDYEVDLLSAIGNGANGIACEIQITNKSSDTLKDIRLFSSGIGGVWCSSARLNMDIESILPEQQLIVNGTITAFENLRFEGDLCVYATNSENILDVAIEDNISCLQVSDVPEITETSLGIYPNPSSRYLHLDSKYLSMRYKIFDAYGCLKDIDVNKGEIDIQALANGIYFLQIEDGSTSSVQRFVKI